jgi:hypothetical protein
MDLELSQLDIDIAFIYAPLKEDVYICQSLGFTDGTGKDTTTSAASMDSNSHPTNSTPCCGTVLPTMAGNITSWTHAYIYLEPIPSSP